MGKIIFFISFFFFRLVIVAAICYPPLHTSITRVRCDALLMNVLAMALLHYMSTTTKLTVWCVVYNTKSQTFSSH